MNSLTIAALVLAVPILAAIAVGAGLAALRRARRRNGWRQVAEALIERENTMRTYR